jgi:hypothetical protein
VGLVAKGLRSAEENDVLELDERKDLRLKTVEQAVAVGSPVPTGLAGRSECLRRPFSQNPRSALEPDSTERQLKGYRQGQSFSDFWKSFEATASSVFEEDETHRQVGKSSGELACAQALFRATVTEASPTGPANPSSLRVRTNGLSHDETVRGVVQRSRHLTSTRYRSTDPPVAVCFRRAVFGRIPSAGFSFPFQAAQGPLSVPEWSAHEPEVSSRAGKPENLFWAAWERLGILLAGARRPGKENRGLPLAITVDPRRGAAENPGGQVIDRSCGVANHALVLSGEKGGCTPIPSPARNYASSG